MSSKKPKRGPGPRNVGALRGTLDRIWQPLQQRMDGWINVLSGLGTRSDPRERTRIKPVKPLTRFELTEAYHGEWLAGVIVDGIVEDALREGFYYKDRPDLDAEAARWKIAQHAEEVGKFSRAFGAAFLLLGTSDPDQSQPLVMGPNKLLYLRVIDRRELTVASRNADPASANFREPDTYWLHALGEDGTPLLGQAGGQTRIHASRLVRVDGTLTARDMMARNEGWPLSVLQRPWDQMRDEGTTWGSVALLLRDLSTAVYSVKDLISMLTGDGPDTLEARMTLVERARSTLNAIVVDKDGEDFKHVGAENISGLPDTLGAINERTAASAQMTLSRLMGQQQGGLSSTGESETRGWFDRVRAYQSKRLAPFLIDVGNVLAANASLAPLAISPDAERYPAPEVREDADEGQEQNELVCFEPLWQETPAECAERENKEQSTWSARILSGEVTAIQVAEHRILGVPLDEIVQRDIEERKAQAKAPPPSPVLPSKGGSNPGDPGGRPDPGGNPSDPGPDPADNPE